MPLDLILEGRRALRLNIPHDHDSALWVVPEADWESRYGLRCFGYALLAVDVSIG